MESRAFGAWSFLSLDRTKFGAPSYADELGACYVYDTTVANGKHVQVGDLAVIRDNRIVYSAGWIDDIEVTAGRKIRHRCPSCGCGTRKPLFRVGDPAGELPSR
jgi:hypothetical protein